MEKYLNLKKKRFFSVVASWVQALADADDAKNQPEPLIGLLLLIVSQKSIQQMSEVINIHIRAKTFLPSVFPIPWKAESWEPHIKAEPTLPTLCSLFVCPPLLYSPISWDVKLATGALFNAHCVVY